MHLRETFNVSSHLVASALATVATAVLVLPPLLRGEHGRSAAYAVFGFTLVVSYAISTLFHGTRGDTRDRFRRLDRAAIYLLIFGGYTPVCLVALRPSWGWPLLGLAATFSILGAAAEWRSSESGQRHSVSSYLLLGWMSLVAIKPLIAAVTPMGVVWLFGGGLLYTLGALTVRFRITAWSHEVWHVMAMAASACHFIAMQRYVV